MPHSPCQTLHEYFRSLPRQRAGYQPNEIRANGIYVVFEKNEVAHGGERIVRIGTHNGQNRLAKRLNEHLYTPNKDRSIFRKHIGRCLLADKVDLLEQWNWKLTSKDNKKKYGHRIDVKAMESLEAQVSDYINHTFSFCVLPVEHKADRLSLESALLSTIAQCSECQPSQNWLGRKHQSEIIRSKGLWNMQGLNSSSLSLDDVQALIKSLI